MTFQLIVLVKDVFVTLNCFLNYYFILFFACSSCKCVECMRLQAVIVPVRSSVNSADLGCHNSVVRTV